MNQYIQETRINHTEKIMTRSRDRDKNWEGQELNYLQINSKLTLRQQGFFFYKIRRNLKIIFFLKAKNNLLDI